MEFLGFHVDLTTMELKLPGSKMRSIREDARKILAPKEVMALEMSKFLGKMNAAMKMIAIAHCFIDSCKGSSNKP